MSADAPLPLKAFGVVALAYVVAIAAAFGVVHAIPTGSPLLKLAVGNLVGTAVVFGFSRASDNTSIYDPYWSVAPLVGAVALLTGIGAGGARSVILILLVSLWSWRLTLNWARSWKGLQHEDWRYADLRKVTGGAYWWASAFGLHLFPTVITVLGTLPAATAFSSEKNFGVLDVIATVITLGAIALETLADEQLRRFRERPSAAVCTQGVWRYSRHPNYFGEIAFWVGVWLFGVAAGAPWWTLVGPLSMVALFNFASIPLMERHLMGRRAGYAEHMRRVSKLLPLPPRPE